MTDQVPQIKLLSPTAVAFGAIAILLAVGTIAAYAVAVGGGPSRVPADWGALGSLVGGVGGTVVAALALIALVQAVRIQHSELTLAMQEITSISKKMSDDQEFNQNQQFETTLQFLLGVHTSNISTISISPGDGSKTFTGRAALRRISHDIKPDGDSSIEDSYYKIYNYNDHFLANYFRTLFGIVNYIKEKSHNVDFHIKIMAAQLSEPEVFLLALNGLTQNGTRFKPLIEEFGLLEHLSDEKRRLIGEDTLSRYDTSAGGSHPL